MMETVCVHDTAPVFRECGPRHRVHSGGSLPRGRGNNCLVVPKINAELRKKRKISVFPRAVDALKNGVDELASRRLLARGKRTLGSQLHGCERDAFTSRRQGLSDQVPQAATAKSQEMHEDIGSLYCLTQHKEISLELANDYRR